VVVAAAAAAAAAEAGSKLHHPIDVSILNGASTRRHFSLVPLLQLPPRASAK